MKLIGFLLVLFVGMSGATHGQTGQDSVKIVSDSTFEEKIAFCLSAIKNEDFEGIVVYADDIILDLCIPGKYNPSDVRYFFSQFSKAAKAMKCFDRAYDYSKQALDLVKNNSTSTIETIINAKLERAFHAESTHIPDSVLLYYSDLMNTYEGNQIDSLSAASKSVALSYLDGYKNIINDSINLFYILHHRLDSLYLNGLYEEAKQFIPFLSSDIDQYYSVNDFVKDSLYANSMSGFAHIYWEQGKYHESLDYNLLALKVYENCCDISQSPLFERLYFIGDSYSKLNQNLLAVAFLKRGFGYAEKIKSTAHIYNLFLFGNRLSNLFDQLGRYEEGISINKQIDNHPLASAVDKITSMNNLREFYVKSGNYDLALEAAKNGLLSVEQYYGKTSEKYVTYLFNVAFVYQDLDDCDTALVLTKKSIQVYEENQMSNPDLFLSIQAGLAASYSCLDSLDKSFKIQQKVLKGRAEMAGKENEDYIRAEYNLAASYYLSGYINEAFDILLECSARAGRVLRPYESQYIDVKKLVADVAGKKGFYDLSQRLYRVALDTAKLYHGENSLLYDNLEHNFASNLHDMGQYEQSKQLNEKCLARREKMYGTYNDKYAVSLYNLASDCEALYEFDIAFQYYNRYLEITEKVSGRQSQNYATGLNNLSLLLSKLSDYENAIKHQELAVKIMEQIGFESKYLYMFKHNLFVYYKEKGDLSKSLAMSLALEKEVLKNLGDFNPLYFSILHHQAMCYKSLGNWQKKCRFKSSLFGTA